MPSQVSSFNMYVQMAIILFFFAIAIIAPSQIPIYFVHEAGVLLF